MKAVASCGHYLATGGTDEVIKYVSMHSFLSLNCLQIKWHVHVVKTCQLYDTLINERY